jgi:antitoxin PrlF
MQTSSQLIHHNQAILPEPVLKALSLREGDAIVFEIDQTGVHLRKAPPIDAAFTVALQGTLNEWNSEADDQAYADL